MKRKKRNGGNRTVPVFFRAESVTAEKVLERERERVGVSALCCRRKEEEKEMLGVEFEVVLDGFLDNGVIKSVCFRVGLCVT